MKRSVATATQEEETTTAQVRQKLHGDGISAYQLQLQDGLMIYEAEVATKFSLLPTLDPTMPVPIPNFHIAAALALSNLTKLISAGTPLPVDTLVAATFAEMIALAEFLGLHTTMLFVLCNSLESPKPEDPLARLRACVQLLPAFPQVLHGCAKLDSAECANHLITKLLTNASASALTYAELNMCDGKFLHPMLKKRGQLSLHRFADAERTRRQLISDAAAAKTKALRQMLVDVKDISEMTMVETFHEAVWGNGVGDDSDIVTSIAAVLSSPGFVLSKHLLDSEMWSAIKEGRVDVARRLLELGAEPAMRHKPELNKDFTSERHDDSNNLPDGLWHGEEMTWYPSSLMLATENNDLHMMRWLMDEAGCDVNLNQPIFVGRDDCDVDNGGLNALWVCKSSEAMLELLSRGCNPNQSCQTEMNMGRFGTRQRSLMVGDGMSSCTVSGHEKLLIRHGANTNTFQMSCGDEDDSAKCESNAYWPNLLQQENVDVEWCRELLDSYGASPNWPFGAETNECGELPGFGPDILLQAVLDTKLDVVELLLQHNANVNLYELPGLAGTSFENVDVESYPYFLPSSGHLCGLFSVPASGGRFLQCPLSAALKIGNKKMIELLKMYGAEADSPMDVTTYMVKNPTQLMTCDTYLTVDAPDAFKTNKHCVIVSVAKDPFSLACASDALKNDKEIVMVAVNKSGSALQHASNALQADKEVVIAAVTNDGDALKFASEELQADKEVQNAVADDDDYDYNKAFGGGLFEDGEEEEESGDDDDDGGADY